MEKDWYLKKPVRAGVFSKMIFSGYFIKLDIYTVRFSNIFLLQVYIYQKLLGCLVVRL